MRQQLLLAVVTEVHWNANNYEIIRGIILSGMKVYAIMTKRLV
jgi:hypothetical protein